MSPIELRQRVREQQVQQKEVVLKYRGVAYIVKRNVTSNRQSQSFCDLAQPWKRSQTKN